MWCIVVITFPSCTFEGKNGHLQQWLILSAKLFPRHPPFPSFCLRHICDPILSIWQLRLRRSWINWTVSFYARLRIFRLWRLTDKIPVNGQAPAPNQVPAEAEEDSDDAQDDEGAAEAGAAGGQSFLEFFSLSFLSQCAPKPYRIKKNLTIGPILADKKKKKKKSKKRSKKKGGAKVQSEPPRVPVSNLFPNGQYPEGEIVEYLNDNAYRTTDEEKRYLDRMNNDFLQEYRQGAEVHRQVRQYAQKNIKPGQTLTEIAEGIEDSVRALTGHSGLEEGDNLKGGMGFPCGLSINHCAAHYTPNAGNKMVLNQGDVMKVDFGAQLNGRIVDSAFTMTFDPVYDPLLAAVKDATNTGIRVSTLALLSSSRL